MRSPAPKTAPNAQRRYRPTFMTSLQSDGRGIEIVGRRLLRLEIAVRIAPADQDGAVLGTGDLADIGWNVAHGKADAPVVRLVRHRAVYKLDVVQGHLPRLQQHVDEFALVHLDCHLLPAGQEIVLRESILVRQDLSRVAAGEKFLRRSRGSPVRARPKR